MRRTLAALTVAAGLVLAPAAAAQAAAAPHVVKTATYKNCTALNKKYPGGVAKSSKARNTKTVNGRKVAAKSNHKPKVSASLYATYKTMDRDKDGIACER